MPLLIKIRLWLVLALLLVAGCGQGDGLVDVSGKVTIDGQTPEKGTIRFEPANGQGPSAEQVIDAGAYKLRVAPGEKKVLIYAYKKIGEHPITGPGSPMVDDLKQLVPPKFNDQTTLKADIKAVVVLSISTYRRSSSHSLCGISLAVATVVLFRKIIKPPRSGGLVGCCFSFGRGFYVVRRHTPAHAQGAVL